MWYFRVPSHIFTKIKKWTIQSFCVSILVQTDKYTVKIWTGKKPGSGTTGEVFIVLRGESQDSGPILLKQSANEDGVITSNKFETGNIDVFSMKMISLGAIKQIQ